MLRDKSKRMEELEAEIQRIQADKDECVYRHSQELSGLERKYQLELSGARKHVKAFKTLRTQCRKLQKGVVELRTQVKQAREFSNQKIRGCFDSISREVSQTLMTYLRDQQGVLSKVQKQYREELLERKRLFNLVQELRGNIRVLCRCRPPTDREQSMTQEDGSGICVSFPADDEINVFNEKRKEKNWEFDRVFSLESTQEEVYAEVSPLVTSVLDGYNVCIFAYGQTGTGKTYTMNGPNSNAGVNMRALTELLDRSRARRDEVVDEVNVSILEIYNEQIQDLLSNDVGSKKLEIRQGPNGMYVTDLTIVPVESIEKVKQLMDLGDANRASASTNMNEHSSRSHSILSVYITSRNVTTGVVSRGKLHLVDLAGSERIGKSGATGQALKEAQSINKSLSALGDVIAALVNKQGHVPFRNSTLTYLLQDSLGGDSKTLMFVCISPVLYNAEESFCSLNFASRVRTVELGKATKNVASSATPDGPRPSAGRGTTASKK